MDPVTPVNIHQLITASKISAGFAQTKKKKKNLANLGIYPRQLRNTLFISGIVAKCQHDIGELPRESCACLEQ